jgi:hypothetical protein
MRKSWWKTFCVCCWCFFSLCVVVSPILDVLGRHVHCSHTVYVKCYFCCMFSLGSSSGRTGSVRIYRSTSELYTPNIYRGLRTQFSVYTVRGVSGLNRAAEKQDNRERRWEKMVDLFTSCSHTNGSEVEQTTVAKLNRSSVGTVDAGERIWVPLLVNRGTQILSPASTVPTAAERNRTAESDAESKRR